MTKYKFYFQHSDSEVCYNEDHFIEEMYENKLTEIEVFEAIPDKMNGRFWCKVHWFCGDDSADTCGKQCREYKPRNGKSGCCKHYTTNLYIHGEKVKLYITNPI